MEVAARGRHGFSLHVQAVRAGLKAPRVVFCFGNDAGDLDSISSAVGVAWWRDSRLTVSEKENLFHVPLMAFPRDEFRLRGDAVLSFKKAGVQLDSKDAPPGLLFLDEFAELTEDGKLLDRSQVAIALSDHNVLTERMENYFGGDAPAKVELVFDHHQDMGQNKDAATRVIDERAGSACTLVSEHILKEEPPLQVPSEIAHLMLNTIAIDTRNFDEKKNRFNDRDARVHKEWCNRFKDILPAIGKDQQKLFKELQEARFDVSHLSAGEMMRLDFKLGVVSGGKFDGSRIGFASIMDSLEGFLARANGGIPGLEAELMKIFEQHDILAIVCFAKPQKIQGQEQQAKCLLFAGDEDVVSAMHKVLTLSTDSFPDELRSNPLFGEDGQDILDKGFNLKPYPPLLEALGGKPTPSMQTFSIRKDITRKTLLPTVLSMASSL